MRTEGPSVVLMVMAAIQDFAFQKGIMLRCGACTFSWKIMFLQGQAVLCSLQRILVAAVVAQDGFAYNGWIIEPWLERYGTSPRTGTPLADTCLPAVPIRCLVYQQTWSLIGV